MNSKIAKPFPIVTLILILGISASAGAVFWKIYQKKSGIFAASEDLPVLGQVADFSLTERGGAQTTLANLHGKIWIADFIFTRCAGICPLMSAKMRGVQNQLLQNKDISFVSFSVDPEHDTPDVLKIYAKKYEADPKRWLFLTGDKKQIFNLSLQHFHLGVGEIPEKDREAMDQSVQHSSKFVLVDARGQIRGYYSSEDESSIEKLIADAEKLTHLL